MFLGDRAKAAVAALSRTVPFEINGDNCSVDICSAGWQSVHYVTVSRETVTDLGGSSLRITCSQGSAGNVYRIYRKDAHFIAELQRIIPFLNECAGSVLIGGSTGDSGVVLTVGPLDADTDAAFQERVGKRAFESALSEAG